MKILVTILSILFLSLTVFGTAQAVTIDFGTQTAQFCDNDTFNSLYAPYYRKMNDWIHEYTGWKSFKHCCATKQESLI